MGDQRHLPHLLGSVSGLLMPLDVPEQDLDIHLSLSRQYSSCLAHGDISPQGLSMHFMTSCTTSEPKQLDPQTHPLSTTSQPVRYPESSQRTTSVFPPSLQYDNPDFRYVTSSMISSAPVPLACHMPPRGRGWISGQDVEQGAMARLDIQPLNYPQSQSPSRQAQVSPDSTSTEYTFTDDSDVEAGIIMSRMMAHFQVPTPSIEADMSMRLPEQEISTPSVMTFRLGRRSLRPVTDPDSTRILENFDDVDEDTSESSCESLSLSSSPLYSPTSFYDARTAEGCGDVLGSTVTGVASSSDRRSPYLLDAVPSSCGSDGNTHSPAPRNSRPKTSGSSKKPKMHECEICHKIFPRPSGLRTHMNSHSGEKPFKCPVSSCDKRFAVRSNAKRHLKTHGISPSLMESPSKGSKFTVGFEEPLVNHHVHDVGRPHTRLRWITHSLATRTHSVGNCDWIGSPSPDGDESEPYPILSALLPAAASCSSSNSTSVYHYGTSKAGSRHSHSSSSQVRARAQSED